MPYRNALENVCHECSVTGEILRTAGGATGNAGQCRVLLLEIKEPLCDRRRLDFAADLDAAAGQIAQDIPPLRVVLKSRVCNASNEAGYIEQVVDFCQIGVGEGVSGEASQEPAGRQCTGREDGFRDLSRWHVMAQEYHPLLRQETIDKNNDGVRMDTIRRQVWVQSEGVR